MFTLIIGGAASGKSEYAESWVQRLDGQRIYLATMDPFDAECRARIRKHQLRRQEMGFLTVERSTDLAGADLPAQGNVLLECMSNLMANELYSSNGGGTEQVLTGVRSVLEGSRHLTVVTNEVFSGGWDYSEETMSYLRDLALVNRALAQEADTVIEVVAGLPNLLKGGLI